MTGPKYYSTAQVSKMARVRHLTILRWITGNKPKFRAPARRDGTRGRFFWTKAEAERFKQWVEENYYWHGNKYIRKGKRLGDN